MKMVISKFRFLALVGAVSLAVVACGGESAPPDTGDEQATGVAEATDTSTEADAQDGGADEPIRIGFFAPITGPAAADGESAQRGAELAVQFVNDDGGVLGRPLELVSYDDAFSPDEAANITRRLIEEDGVAAVVSGSYSSPTRAAAPIAQRAAVPFMASYAVHPSITETGEYVWRVGALATVQGRVGGELVVEDLGADNVALLIVDNDFGASLSDAFRQRVEESGATIVYEERFPLGETDFRPLLGGLADAAPDAIYAIGYYNEASALVEQAAEAGVEAQIVGQEGYDSPTFIELAGEAAEGVIITTDLNRDSEEEAVQEFLTRFEEEYGTAADIVGASSFDGVRVVAAAIEQAGATEPEAILEGLRSLTDFGYSVTSIQSFTDGREVVRPITAQVVEGGEFHLYAEFDDPELVDPSS